MYVSMLYKYVCTYIENTNCISMHCEYIENLHFRLFNGWLTLILTIIFIVIMRKMSLKFIEFFKENDEKIN